MNLQNAIIISLEILGAIIALIFMSATAILGYVGNSKMPKNHTRLVWLEFTVACVLFANATSIVHDGTFGLAGNVMHFAIFLEFLGGYFAVCEFTSYLRALIQETSGADSRGRVYAVYILNTISIVLLVITRWTGWFFTFDAGHHYVVGKYFFISPLFAIISGLLDVSLIVQYRYKIGLKATISLLIYLALPIIGAILEILFDDIPFINLAFMIDAIIIFMTTEIQTFAKVRNQQRKLYVSQMETIMAQTNPAYIFESLDAIKELCEKGSETAVDAVNSLSLYLKGSLSALNEQKCISFKEELSYAKNYIVLEQQKDRRDIVVDYDLRECDFEIPSMTLQPLVENALKHAFVKKERGSISISSWRDGNDIKVSVADDGDGFDVLNIDQSSNICVGIENVRYRVELACEGKLEIESVIGEGTVATITIPTSK